MQSLLKMLPTMIRLAGDNEAVREEAVFTAWRAAAGELVRHACVPFRLYQRTLIVAVKDAMWKRHMERESRGFIFKLNSLLGAPLVTYIEFREDPEHVRAAQSQEESRVAFQHTRELAEELKPAAEQIRNDGLREVFLRAAARCLERKEQ